MEITSYISLGILGITLYFTLANTLDLIRVSVMKYEQTPGDEIKKYTFLLGLESICTLFFAALEMLLMIQKGFDNSLAYAFYKTVMGIFIFLIVIGLTTYFGYKNVMAKPINFKRKIKVLLSETIIATGMFITSIVILG
jgi:hypothetical protein